MAITHAAQVGPSSPNEPETHAAASSGTDNQRITKAVASVLLRHRKVQPTACSRPDCPDCLDKLSRRVIHRVANGEPIVMVKSAFPYKIANPTKTLGRHADRAEFEAIRQFKRLVDDIADVYSPGAKFVIGSDGLPFAHVDAEWSDLQVSHIHDYVADIRAEIRRVGGADRIEVTTLADHYPDRTVEEMRSCLERDFAKRTRNEAYALCDSKEYTGIKRAFNEDVKTGTINYPSKGKALQHAKKLAIETIYFSLAWRNLLSDKFPDAVRLSIHPLCLHQTEPGQEKLGLKMGETYLDPIVERVHALGETVDISPWQSAWVETGSGCGTRMKRWVAEKLGGELGNLNGRPSHFKLHA